MNNQTTRIVAAIIIAAGIIGAVLVVTRSPAGRSSADKTAADTSVVRMEGGTQIIEITAKGGYSPRSIAAKAGVPTVLRVRTKSTFDCSAAFTVPSLGIRTMLPPSGVTDFPVPARAPGDIVRGLCAMGMYSVTIEFN